MSNLKYYYLVFAQLVAALILMSCQRAIPGVGVVPTEDQIPSETSEPTSTETPVDSAETPQFGFSALLEVLDVSPDGEVVKLGFTLTNNTDSSLYVLQWYTPLEGVYGNIFQVQRDSQAIPYLGIEASRGAPIPEDYVLLKPGGSAFSGVDLASSYDFSQVGIYTIRFKSPLISHFARTKADMAKTVDELHPVQMPANPVTVRIGEANVEPAPQMLPTTTPRPVLSREAVDLVQSYLRLEEPISLEELNTDEIWDNLRVQVFKIVEDPYANESFLIRKKVVVPMGTAYGGQGLTSLEMSDLDGDGEAELLFTYNFGSGIHQSRVAMYAPAYAEYQVLDAEFGYLGDIGLFRTGIDEIGVKVVEVDPSNLTIRYLDTLGFLAIEENNGIPKLVLEILPDLPVEIEKKIFSPQTSESRPPKVRPVGLVYTMGSGEGLWIVDRDGQNVKLTEHSNAQPSPDFQKILYNNEDDIFIEDLISGERQNLTDTPDKVERGYQWWPANPNAIVFNFMQNSEEGPSEGYLATIDSAGNDYHILDESTTSFTSPALSPDGNSIAYNPGGVPTLYRLDAGIETLHESEYGLEFRVAASPAWSPDGRLLAWKVFGDEPDEGYWSGVAVFDMAESKTRLLHKYRILGGTNVMPGLSWSPDGRWLAVLTQGEFPMKTPSLWVLSADGAEEYYLGSGISPVWSPDGRWLAYASWPPGGGHYEEPQVFILDIESWKPKLVDLPFGAVVVDWVSLNPYSRLVGGQAYGM